MVEPHHAVSCLSELSILQQFDVVPTADGVRYHLPIEARPKHDWTGCHFPHGLPQARHIPSPLRPAGGLSRMPTVRRYAVAARAGALGFGFAGRLTL